MNRLLTGFLVIFLMPGLTSFADTVEKDKGYVSVNATSTKEVSPNQAEITIGIETSDKSLQKASDDNKIIANKVYSSLKMALGVGDYIKTNAYSAKPQYTYTKDNKKVLDKYVVTNTVTVKTKSTELVPRLIDTAISQGATNVENLQFLVTDYDSACNDALADLTKKSYTQAASVAKSINSQIVGVKSINATCNTDNNPAPYYSMMKSAADGVSATPISAGKVKIYANIDASYYVK